VAAQHGIYRYLLEGDLTRPLSIASGEYAAVVCAGTFTSGHVDAACLDELVRILQPGGWLVCTVHHAVWEPLGFASGFARLVDAGALAPVVEANVGYYVNSSNDGRLLVYRVAV
jgi:SAM-dependent methyltransferase